MSHFLTPHENIALSAIFLSLGEARGNRTIDEYMAIADRAPKQLTMHQNVNRVLMDLAISDAGRPQICRFKAGDQGRRFEEYPIELSPETVRRAWEKSGMRELQKIAKRKNKKAR
jgi:hypothetical protein